MKATTEDRIGHTPGLWTLDGTGRHILSPFGVIASLPHVNIYEPQADVAFERRLANGCLLRTAPDLLRLLKQAERFVSGFEGDDLQEGIDDLLTQMRRAITLAEGDTLAVERGEVR
jgi:transketolase C-terminal domain/subunit